MSKKGRRPQEELMVASWNYFNIRLNEIVLVVAQSEEQACKPILA